MIIKLKVRYIFAVLILFTTSVHATSITYDVENVGGNTWEYTYTVENNTLGFDIEEFTIWFDLGLYENLTATSTPADWDPLVIQPDNFLPDDGFYDALVFGPGIAPGASLGGFSVQFDYLGMGTPDSQFYDIVDPFTFGVLGSGNTIAVAAPPGEVPEPGVLWLMAFGLLGWLTFRPGVLK